MLSSAPHISKKSAQSAIMMEEKTTMLSMALIPLTARLSNARLCPRIRMVFTNARSTANQLARNVSAGRNRLTEHVLLPRRLERNRQSLKWAHTSSVAYQEIVAQYTGVEVNKRQLNDISQTLANDHMD